MTAVLRWTVEIHVGVPTACELFERAHVDGAVMQVLHEFRHVVVQELLVGSDGVTGQQRLDARRSEALDVFDHLGLRLIKAQTVLPFVDQSGTGVHLAHEIVHVIDGLLAGLDHIVDAFIKHIEIEIRRNHGNLDKLIAAENVKSRHLAVDPNQA